MMKQFPYISLQFLLFSILSSAISCQSSEKFPGVYAGVKLSLNPLGGGMNRTDVVILLREDKTFTDQLHKQDWKTAIRGKYEIKGTSLYLKYNNGNQEELSITKAGNLDAGTYVLFKMELDNRIPKGAYQFKFINGSGGMATGTTYVGTSSRSTLNFDGVGNFSTDKHSTTVISGNNIGGGTNTKSDGQGKYELKDGKLTLSYANGNTTTHSFFASAASGKNKAMAVIDGNFYFMDDDPEQKMQTKKVPTASEILEELRKKYGGTMLDGLKTYEVEAEFNGILLISYNDLASNRFRNEMYQKGKLIAIEQMANQKGWILSNGKKTINDTQRMQVIRYNDYIGVLGLQTKNNAAFSKGTVKAIKEGYSVSFEVDGHDFTYIIDPNYDILGDSYVIGNSKQFNSYSNNQTVSGVRMPFKTVTSDGQNKVTLNYKSIKVNQPLNTSWREQ
jgi:hypothetical protein